MSTYATTIEPERSLATVASLTFRTSASTGGAPSNLSCEVERHQTLGGVA